MKRARFLRGCVVLLFMLAAPLGAENLLIPLDDRPANLLFVRQIARIGGLELKVPPRNLLGKLYTPGQPEALSAWLTQKVKAGDRVFVCADMLAYGGLVASRNADTSHQQALQRLEILTTLKERGARLQVMGVIPRLSLRTSEAQAPHERTLANWATKPGAPPPDGVPPEVIDEYLAVRRRNLAVLEKLVELGRRGVLEKVVLGQDDSHKTGLHQEEQEQLRAAAGDHPAITLLSGVDELSMDLIAGAVAESQAHHPTVRVTYSDPEAAEKVPPLESLPLGQMVEQHLRLAGAVPDEGEQAEVDLFIYVPSNKPWNVPGEEARPPAEAFVEQVATAVQAGRRVAVADLSLVNRMDPFIAQAVIDRLPLHQLQGFASWNTPANAVGTVIAQLVVHRCAETARDWKFHRRLESEKTHQAFLLARMIDDYGFQTLVREQVRDQAQGLSSTADPLLNLFGPVGLDTRLRLIEFANQLYDQHFRGQTLKLLPFDKEVSLGHMHLEVVLPWPRVFEVEARLDLTLDVKN